MPAARNLKSWVATLRLHNTCCQLPLWECLQLLRVFQIICAIRRIPPCSVMGSQGTLRPRSQAWRRRQIPKVPPSRRCRQCCWKKAGTPHFDRTGSSDVPVLLGFSCGSTGRGVGGWPAVCCREARGRQLASRMFPIWHRPMPQTGLWVGGRRCPGGTDRRWPGAHVPL